MRVAFLCVGDVSLARIMLASVRAVMPHAALLHMTDSATAVLPGCERWELPYDGERLMTYRMQHLAALDAQPTLILDTDVIVQRDLSDVFAHQFDVALTKRTDPIMRGGINITEMMPYNTGVMFSREPTFWQHCHLLLQTAGEDVQRWWGDQLAVQHIAKSGAYRVLELDCNEYNYSPAAADEDVSQRAVVHYKGRRKEWMRSRESDYLRATQG